MPCLNEEETLSKCIVKALRSIEAHNLNAEILIADNGSTDRSRLIANNLGARVIDVKEKGYGNTLRAGIFNSKGRFIIMGDSDDSYDFSDLMPFITNLRNGDDLVVGNRFKGGIQKNAMPFLHRYLGNPVLSFLGRLFFKTPVKDFHCGLRGMNKSSIIELGLSTSGMEFASEMIVKSAINNLKVSEVPIKLYCDGRSRDPHLNTWRDGWRHLCFLLVHSPKWLFLYPGLLFLLIGLLSASGIFIGAVRFGIVNLDLGGVSYLSILSIIGFQSVFFYFFSTIRRDSTGIYSNTGAKFFQNINDHLNICILGGGGMFLIGIMLTVYSLRFSSIPFNQSLATNHIAKILVPAVTSSLLGIQVVFNSFFLSILNARLKE